MLKIIIGIEITHSTVVQNDQTWAKIKFHFSILMTSGWSKDDSEK